MRRLRGFVVPAIGLLVFASGVLNIVSALGFGSRLRMRFLETFMPWPVLSASRSLTLLFGFLLIFLAVGLWQRKKRAMQLSLLILVLSFVFHLVKGLDIEEALILLIPVNLLFIFNDEFSVESSVPKFLEAVRNSAVILLLLFVYSVFGYFLFQGEFVHPVTLENIGRDYEFSVLGLGEDVLIPQTRRALWFSESISVVGVGAVILVFANLFAPVFLLSKPSKEDRDWVRHLISHFGENSVDYYALQSDKNFFFSKSRRSVIAYRLVRGSAVVLGGPIGAGEDKKSCVSDFIAEMKRRGLASVFYQLNDAGRELLVDLGMKVVKIGEQAVIKTASFSTKGPQMAEVRHSVTRVEKEKVEFRISNFATVPWKIAADVDDLRRRWFIGKKIPALTFAADFYPLPVEDDAFLLTAYSSEGKILAALSFLPYKAGKGEVLDLMLRDEAAFNGLMEGAIAWAIAYFHKIGKDEVSLALAPLADVTPEGKTTLFSKSKELVFKRFKSLYRFQPLFSFKQKFDPIWEHVYIGYERDTQLPNALVALLSANLRGRM